MGDDKVFGARTAGIIGAGYRIALRPPHVQIQSGCLVSLRVAMSDAQGNLLEASDDIVYLHGAGDIFPRIEEALGGHGVGFKTTVRLLPHDAFGEFDPELVHLVDTDALGTNVTPGLRYEGLPGQPDARTYTVTDVAEGKAVLDGNHPLAGRTLRFDLEVTAVEPASAEDLESTSAVQVPDFLRVVAPHDLHDGDGDRWH